MDRQFGVHSEVGKLRKVMVCRPGCAHQRLTPGNCHDLLFDDVIWVQKAQKDHFDFVLKMRERGVEVLELHDLLAETMDDSEARAWVLDRRITANTVGPVDRRGIAPMAGRAAGRAAGGAPDRRHRGPRPAASEWSVTAAGEAHGRSIVPDAAAAEHALPARPVLLDLRRRHLQPDVLAGAPAETLLQRAVYKFHPTSRTATSRSGSATPTRTLAAPRSRAAT